MLAPVRAMSLAPSKSWIKQRGGSQRGDFIEGQRPILVVNAHESAYGALKVRACVKRSCQNLRPSKFVGARLASEEACAVRQHLRDLTPAFAGKARSNGCASNLE